MPRRQFHTLALLVVLFGVSPSVLGCDKSKEATVAPAADSPKVVATGIRQRIEQTIQDTHRRDALLEDMDEIDVILAEMVKTVVLGLDTLATADADRDKRKDDFRGTHAEIREARNAAIRRYIDIRLQMRELLTEDEWNQISSGVPR